MADLSTTRLAGVASCARALAALAPGVVLLLAFASCAATPRAVRFATFNVALNRDTAGTLVEDLRGGTNPQARALAEIIQRVRPNVLLLNEVDFAQEGTSGADAIQIFAEEYLAVPQGDAEPIVYPVASTGPVNTGVPTGLDLDGDGATDGPADAFGFGHHPGQYGFALLSQAPIVGARSFQQFLWADMPDARIPRDFYSDAACAVLRLSSKNHLDLAIQLPGDRVVHLLASHPTPPGFDGPEDRNGRRNYDEIRLWADYITPGAGEYLLDDRGQRGGLDPAASFVILGDLNADPADGDDGGAAIAQLLEHPRVHPSGRDAPPASEGGTVAAAEQAGANADHRGDPAHDTGDFFDAPGRGPGNLRVDYVLPSADLEVAQSGVYWPAPGQPGAELVTHSDHRMVWVDIVLR